MCGVDHKMNKMSLRQTDDIEILSKRLESLKITNEVSSKTNEQSDEEMSIAPAPAMTNNNVQAIIPKSIVLDLE